MGQEGIIVGFMILLAGFISIEIGISTAIFEIVAGVIASNLIGLTSPQWIDFLSNFGLLGIMFFAGLETDPVSLRKNIKTNLGIGATAYLLPMTVITLTSAFIFQHNFETSFLIAISLSTTSVALIYAVVKEMGLMGSEPGQTILGSAMMVDILSMLSLTFFVGDYGIYTLVYAALLFFLLYLAPRIGKTLFKRYSGHMAEMEIKFILLLLLTLPFFSEHTGISEAVFSFILGMVFSEIVGKSCVVEDKLRGIVFGFFAPAFFFKSGLLINFSLMNVKSVFFILVMGIIAYLSKYIFTYLAFSSFLKRGSLNAHLTGAIFNFRLTFGIFAALFGYMNSYISGSIYAAILMIILISSLVSSALLHVLPSENI